MVKKVSLASFLVTWLLASLNPTQSKRTTFLSSCRDSIACSSKQVTVHVAFCLLSYKPWSFSLHIIKVTFLITKQGIPSVPNVLVKWGYFQLRRPSRYQRKQLSQVQKKKKYWPSSREAVCTKLTWWLKSLIWTVRIKSYQLTLSALRCFNSLVKLSLLRFVKVHDFYNSCLCLSTEVCPSGDASPQKTSLVVSTGTGGVTVIYWVEVGEAAKLSATHSNVLLLTTEASGPKR